MYKRQQYKELLERILEPRRFIQAIAGPRQIGKSTLVMQVVKECGLPYTLGTAAGIAPDDTAWISEFGIRMSLLGDSGCPVWPFAPRHYAI